MTKLNQGPRVPSSRSGPQRRKEWMNILADNGQRQVDSLGTVKMKDMLRQEVYGDLVEFRRCCEKQFSSKDRVWAALQEACVKSGEARLRRVEFSQAARLIGFEGNTDVVFDALDLDLLGTISSADLDFLHIGTSHAKRKSRFKSFSGDPSSIAIPGRRKSTAARKSVIAE